MESSSKKAIIAALIGNCLIAATKFIAAALTGSSAMLSEGIHSVVDTGNQVLLLYGIRRSQLPADARFPFGRGKEVYFWSFVVAIMIFAVGAGVSVYEGIRHILAPQHIENPTVNYVVLGLALLFEGGSWLFALREFSRAKGKWNYFQAVARGKDPSLFVVVFEDSAAMLGLAVAFVGILLGQLTGSPYYDGAASIVIGLILGGTAAWLAFETKGLLIGESANPEVVDGLCEIIARYPEIDHLNEVLTMHMGPDFILVNVSVDFADDLTADRLESTIESLDKEIKAKFPRVKRVFVEAEARSRKKTTGEAVA